MKHASCFAVVSLVAAVVIGAPCPADEYKGKRFEGVSFAESTFERCNFYHALIRNSQANYLGVEYLTASQAKLDNVKLDRARIRNLSLTAGVAWTGGKLSGSLNGVELRDLKLERCPSRDIALTNMDIYDMDCRDLSIRDLSVDDLEAYSASFEDIESRYSQWRNVDLTYARMERVDLRGGQLSNWDLTGVRASRCDLRNARFDNCDISGLEINGYDIEELIRKAGR